MTKIVSITASEILDSRANPTIQTKVTLDDGSVGVASVPSGASVGALEALELRDNDLLRYNGLGVLKAIENVTKVIGPGLAGVDPSRQFDIDRWMIKVDGTENKSKFGANTILSISLAVCKAAANAEHLDLFRYVHKLYTSLGAKVDITRVPTPVFNVINGGKHGAGNLDFQEFHIIPSSANNYPQALRVGSELYHKVKKVLRDKNAIHSVGDEGGFAPDLYTNLDALEVIIQAVKESAYRFGEDVFIGLDVAASNFFKNGMYRIRDKQQPFTTDQFIDYLVDLNGQYHLLLLEDPLSDADWKSWKTLNEKLGDSVIIVGDDLLVTNVKLLDRAIAEKTCSAILVKPNQIGTVTETMEVVKKAKENHFKVNVSHRSGETTDTFIADFAVGVQSDYVKFGAPARGERTAKYNRLLEIYDILNA